MPMNDDEYQAEMDMHTLRQMQEMTPERAARARAMAAKKAQEMEEVAQQSMGPRQQSDMMTKGYKVLKGQQFPEDDHPQ
jgi:hypothetical protein